MSRRAAALTADPGAWYKDAVVYELHVRAFFDSNGDGIGDFAGLTQKLDYLVDLGVTAVWLLPFYPSPLRDDGYDISDYFGVHPDYGGLAQFRAFLRAAKKRGLKVITELVLNHTSDQHALFQKSRRAPAGSAARDFYVWSTDPGKFKEARVIFKDFEASNWTWDETAKAYYWHRFFSHQPDLNYDNPAVRDYILKVVDFWLGLGVDGLRLDGVPYLFEREGTTCENLPETHAFLKELRRHVDRRFSGRMLLAEANQWPEDAAAYFGAGDECHMSFHFPLMPRLFMAVHMEDSFPIFDILRQTPDVSERGQWAIFLRNHDELTLEMVSEEERDYMYRFYAQDPRARINLGIRRRLAPLLRNHRRKIELLNGLLFSLPGTPILYYGDETGMGDNIHLGDRNGVRTPMQWSADRNAGFSRASPQALYLPITSDPEYHYEAVNVDVQQGNPHSLFWWMKHVIELRKRHKAFGRGSLEFVGCENRKILAFIRSLGSERILVVANLSRFVQPAELDLSKYEGMALVEMFGRLEFPKVRGERTMVTLGPHSFYWFRLRPPTAHDVDAAAAPAGAPLLRPAGGWKTLFEKGQGGAFDGALAAFLRGRHWFEGRPHKLRSVRVFDQARLAYGRASEARLCLVRAEFVDAPPELYLLPLAYARGEDAKTIRRESPFCVVAEVQSAGSGRGRNGILFDATNDPAFCAALLESLRVGRRLPGRAGEFRMTAAAGRLEETLGGASPAPALSKGAQRNTSVVFGDRLILKLFRRVHEGVNPDAEIGRALSRMPGAAQPPALAGEVTYLSQGGAPRTLGVLHAYVPNRGDAWQFTLDSLRLYFEAVLTGPKGPPPRKSPASRLLAMAECEPSAVAVERIGAFLETAKLLGRRTAELHRALSAVPDAPEFAPEDFGELYQRSIHQTLRNRANEAFYSLRRKLDAVGPDHRALADGVLRGAEGVFQRYRRLLDKKLSGRRIRCHGDFHLKQVLYTGHDFQIIDFEGPAAQSLQERRVKRSPLRDVAGMVRSFEDAAYTILYGRVGVAQEGKLAELEPWADFWHMNVSAAFLRSYLGELEGSGLLPSTRAETAMLLEAFLLDRALEEVREEVETAPQWAFIPLKGVARLLSSPSETGGVRSRGPRAR